MGYFIIMEMLIFSASFSHLKITSVLFLLLLMLKFYVVYQHFKMQKYLNKLIPRARRGYIQVCIGSM